ncbi:MAG: hypothetical protein WCH43_02445 [Verrucomicrobiota bacterium]
MKSTRIAIKPLPGDVKKDGTPKKPSDKKAATLEFCHAIERAENSAKAGTLSEQAAKKIYDAAITD